LLLDLDWVLVHFLKQIIEISAFLARLLLELIIIMLLILLLLLTIEHVFDLFTVVGTNILIKIDINVDLFIMFLVFRNSL